MEPGARTPEELETLFEDAFVARDAEAVGAMFADGAVLVCGPGDRQARGAEEIARLAAALWDGDAAYVAEPRRVVQARDTALVLGTGGVSVHRRGRNGGWRYAIALLTIDHPHPEGGKR
jgi:ketosteroid isomerase-like protein